MSDFPRLFIKHINFYSENKDIIKMNFREIVYGGDDWIELN